MKVGEVVLKCPQCGADVTCHVSGFLDNLEMVLNVTDIDAPCGHVGLPRGPGGGEPVAVPVEMAA